MIAAVYARKSNEQNSRAEQDKSVTLQIDHAKATAAAKGWSISDPHIFTDDGISGAEFERRPGLSRLLSLLKPRPPFQALLVYDRDRIGREQIETAFILKQLVRAGVRVFECKGAGRELMLDTPTNKIVMAIEDFAGEVERVKARTRTYDAMAHRARAGRSTGGLTFGYVNRPILDSGGRRSHVERIIEPREAVVVERIFRLAADGWGVKRIAGALNAEGAPAPKPRRSGRPHGWAPSSVREILGRETYRGVLVWNKSQKRDCWGQQRQQPRDATEWVRVPVPGLRVISDALWQAAHDQLDGRRALYLAQNGGRAFGRPASGVASPYLLTGVGTCAACGGSMAVLKRAHGPRGHRRQVPFYGCMTRHLRGDAICDNGLQVRLSDADGAVLSAVEHDVLRIEILEASFYKAMARLHPADEVVDGRERDLRGELGRLDTEVARLAAAVAAGGELPALLALLQELERRRAAGRGELTRLEGKRGTSGVGTFDGEKVLAELRTHVADWQRTLRQEPAEARRGLRALLAGRLVFTPAADFYTFEGPGTITPVLAGVVRACAKGVVSPTGFDDESTSTWTCVRTLALGAS
jgi:DNA invertase Pin-like site-specific DNA recombinase